MTLQWGKQRGEKKVLVRQEFLIAHLFSFFAFESKLNLEKQLNQNTIRDIFLDLNCTSTNMLLICVTNF